MIMQFNGWVYELEHSMSNVHAYLSHYYCPWCPGIEMMGNNYVICVLWWKHSVTNQLHLNAYKSCWWSVRHMYLQHSYTFRLSSENSDNLSLFTVNTCVIISMLESDKLQFREVYELCMKPLRVFCQIYDCSINIVL